jgi:siderophore synthetase component
VVHANCPSADSAEGEDFFEVQAFPIPRFHIMPIHPFQLVKFSIVKPEKSKM